MRAVVSGRVVNGFLGNDWARGQVVGLKRCLQVLAFLYRYLEWLSSKVFRVLEVRWGVSVAGLSQVQVPGVENVNLDGLGIQGHHDYPRHIVRLSILIHFRGF